jgi:excisionase family DNA binding protein
MNSRSTPETACPVLDASGAAALLHVSTKTILKLARIGELPARKVGREWRFARSALLEYVAGGSSV